VQIVSDAVLLIIMAPQRFLLLHIIGNRGTCQDIKNRLSSIKRSLFSFVSATGLKKPVIFSNEP
jgi:hypothetical protein